VFALRDIFWIITVSDYSMGKQTAFNEIKNCER